jgi:hypothetical protein
MTKFLNSGVVTLLIGALLIFFSVATTNLRGMTPGSELGPPPSKAFRIVMFCGGVYVVILGIFELAGKRL